MIRLTRDINLNTQRIWRNDPRVYGTCRQVTILSQEEHERYWRKVDESKEIIFFAVEVPRTGEKIPWRTVGTIGLTSIDHIHNTAEYSLLIDPEMRGHGYGYQALRELLRIAFNELNLNLVWGEIFEANEPGVRVAKKCGFEVEGCLRQRYFKNGKYTNTFMVSITRGDWLRQKIEKGEYAAVES